MEIKCKICDKTFVNDASRTKHIKREHIDITIEEYFVKYFSLEEFGLNLSPKVKDSILPLELRMTNICLECKEPKCKFLSFTKGFNVFCSEKCAFVNVVNKQNIGKLAKESLEKKYGVSNPSQLLDHKEKSRQTSIRKWGVDNPNKVAAIKQKIAKTNKEKWGTEYYTQTDDYKEKVRKTSLNKRGIEHHTKSEDVKEKIKQTCLEKYGVPYALQDNTIRKQIEKTNIEKYGNKSFLATQEARDKMYAAFEQKYGGFPMNNKEQWKVITATNFRAQSKRNVIDSDLTIRKWLEEQSEPKPAYSTIKGYFANKPIAIDALEAYLENFKNNKTFVEHVASELFGSEHFGKKPNHISEVYKPDFALSDNVYVNVDGLFWHSEKMKNKIYHFEMRQIFENANLRILQFREDEILHKKDIVKSIVNNALHKTTNKIFGRKCQIKNIDQQTANDFLEENHLMGSIKAKHVGLYYGDTLVCLLSYKSKNNVCKIERFCSKINTNVIGAFSKLLKHLEDKCISNNITEIHNWVDLRYGTGKHLLDKDFHLTRETLGWKWTNGRKTFNRLKCKANMDERKLSEKEYAKELGWYKIYDAGQRLYIKTI